MQIIVFRQNTGQELCGQELDIITVVEETGIAGRQLIIKQMDPMDVLI